MEDCKLVVVACQLENSLEQKYDVVVAYTPSSDTCLQLCKKFCFFHSIPFIFTSYLER